MKEAIIAGLISGLISPIILSWFQHRLIWKTQKRLEIKFNIFTDAVTALSALETDSTNPKLQKNKSEYKGMTRVVELRPETEELIEKSRGMVKAFYAEEDNQYCEPGIFLPSIVGRRVRQSRALESMVTHMSTDRYTWMRRGEKAIAENPRAKPRALASTGEETYLSASSTGFFTPPRPKCR